MSECADLFCKSKELLNYLLPNFLWVLVGFGFGLAVYWWRIGQLKNEIESLSNLFWVRFKRGDEFFIKAGVDVKAADGSGKKMVTSDAKMLFGYERGVDWFFCPDKGLFRSRVLTSRYGI